MQKEEQEGRVMKLKIVNCICVVVMLLISLIGLIPNTAKADVMYESFVKDSFGNLISVQPPYQPVGYIGRQIFIEDPKNPGQQIPSPMKNPNDVFIDHNDYI